MPTNESVSSNSDSDRDDDLSLETPKLSELLNTIDVYRYYISAKKLNARKVKQAKLSNFFKERPGSK